MLWVFLVASLCNVHAESSDILDGFFPLQLPLGWISPFEPAKFSAEVRTCHIECGELYYDCAFIECGIDDSLFQPETDFTSKESSESSIWNKLLRIFSFGFLGNTKADESDDFVEYAEKARNRNPYKCVRRCIHTFRQCYKDCICERVAKTDRLGISMCFEDKKVSAATFPTLLGTILFKPQEMAPPREYNFNWKKIQ